MANESDVEAVLRQALIPLEEFEQPLDVALENVPSLIEPASRIFRQHLSSYLSVAAIPYTMVNQHVVGIHHQRILSAERIRALKYSDTHSEEQRESLARGTAGTRFSEFLYSDDGKKRIVEEILSELRALLEVSDLAAPFQDLLLETIVMMWGAFESFISDSMRAILNDAPATANSMVQNIEVRKITSLKQISIEDLALRGFDLSRSMGDYLLDQIRFDSLPVIRAVTGALYPKATELRTLLGKDEFWKLWQRRNLIAHKRGVVDNAYLSKTSDKIAQGTRLVATGQYVESAAILLRDTGIAFIAAVRGA